MTAQSEAATLLEQVLQLPVTLELTVPADYLDGNGHMNMMYYTGVGNMALRRFHHISGLPTAKFKAGERSMFAIRQVLSYLSECREGDKIEVHSGVLGHDARRIHFFHYVVNLTNNRLSSTDERLAIYIDMTTRRSTVFEPDVVVQLDEAIAKFTDIGWTPELSGAIKLKK